MMMDWLILLLLVPAILVPIVLLCGFAGCGLVVAYGCEGDGDCPAGSRCVDGACLPPGEPGTPPSAPEGLVATAVSDSEIDLLWTDNDPAVTNFQVERAREDEDFAKISEPTGQTFQDTGLEAGTTFHYRVRAVVGQDPPSEPSDPPATATTLFTTAFDASTGAPTIQNNPGARNFTFVQRISAAQLLAGGSKVVITVRGAPTGNMTINNIFISRAAGSGNLYDSAADLTAVLTSALTLPDDQPVDLGPIAYILDRTQDLIIAFDLSTTATAGNSRFVRRTGVTLFFQQGVQEASSQSRAAGYGTAGTDPELFFVVTIGVA